MAVPHICRWLDSCHDSAQVDEGELPSPSELVTVGWLSREEEDYIVLSRDYSPHPGSYSWRANLAIPRAHILELRALVKLVKDD